MFDVLIKYFEINEKDYISIEKEVMGGNFYISCTDYGFNKSLHIAHKGDDGFIIYYDDFFIPCSGWISYKFDKYNNVRDFYYNGILLN